MVLLNSQVTIYYQNKSLQCELLMQIWLKMEETDRSINEEVWYNSDVWLKCEKAKVLLILKGEESEVIFVASELTDNRTN